MNENYKRLSEKCTLTTKTDEKLLMLLINLYQLENPSNAIQDPEKVLEHMES